MAEQAGMRLVTNRDVRLVYTAIGGGSRGGGGREDEVATSGSNVRTAVITLKLTPRAERRGLTRQDIEGQMRESLVVLPGVRVAVGMGGSSSYALVLAGDDSRVLERHALQVERELRSIPGIGAITSSA